MKRKSLIIFLIFLMTMAIFVPAKQVFAKKVLLKTQSLFPLTVPLLGKPVVWFSKMVKEASDGNVIFKLYDPGKLVPPMEILESVSKGQIQAGFSASAFWQGKVPAAPLFGSVPFGPEGPEYVSWMLYGNGLKLWQEAYDKAGYNVKVFPLILVPPETSGWFSKEIKTLEDMKGLKIRFYGLGGPVLEKLGASATMTPPAEIFAALEKGAIDAAEYSSPVVDASQGFYKVAKYNYYPGWHQIASFDELLINKDVWNKMSQSQRTLIEMGIKATLIQTLAIGEGSQAAVMKENAEKHGVKNMYWSKELLDAFKKAWDEVVQEQCAKDAMFKKVWEDLSAFRANYKFYSRLSYLPREVGPK